MLFPVLIGVIRPDAIDPALRRPGRFDRELCFNLPSKQSRKEILKIHTKSWNPAVSDELLNELSEVTVGYCGADLESLCREAFLHSIQRIYPQIYVSNTKLKIDKNKLVIIKQDFMKAIKDIIPSSQRSNIVYAKPLNKIIKPLLDNKLNDIKNVISNVFSVKKGEINDNLSKYHYRYLIYSNDINNGQNYLGCALLHIFEEYPMYSIDLPTLYGDSQTKNAEETLLKIFNECSKNIPCILYWPHIYQWWTSAHDTLKTCILLLINDIPKHVPILLIATCDTDINNIPDELKILFDGYDTYNCDGKFSKSNIKLFWKQLEMFCKQKPTKRPKNIDEYPRLPIDNTIPQETQDKYVIQY